MYFTKTLTAPNDAGITHHKVISVLMQEDDSAFSVLVHSWASSAAREAGYDPLWREQYVVESGDLVYTSGFREGLLAYLSELGGGLMLDGADSSITPP
jgi:hypothetical protein